MPCSSEIQAAFILSSLVTFFSGLLILFLCRIMWIHFKKCQNLEVKGILLELFLRKNTPNKHLKKLHFQGAFREHIEMLLSAQTLVGQVLIPCGRDLLEKDIMILFDYTRDFLMILVFLLSIGSLIIYFINSNDPVGSCSSYEDKTIPIDLTFNTFFSFYFGLRFVAADDKIKFWLEMNSIVDIFTIPPTFISYYLKSNWLGLRFLRALRLLELPQILQILQAIKTSNSVKFSKLLSIILSTWFTAAGIIHLVENSGDPWLRGRNSQNMSYFESIYLVMATTSTVGFGDVVAKTSLGRTFIMVFTLGSLIIFANYVPEILELFANQRKYTNSYKVVKGKKFIVVCGNITVDTVTAFLRNFLRLQSGKINTEIVFLGEVPPSLELETIFKCYMAYTSFVSGSALKWEDLRRVAVESAEACLIIANQLCSDSHAEDTSNIMRVLSIKNYNPKIRIIIQILQSHNKVYLPKIPSWNCNAGDNIICFAELKLGFIAQGCLVPGLCTFLTSLFIEHNEKVTPKHTWQKHFFDGLRNKILTQRLSNDFAGMNFPEVARICFVKMNLMLIAIEHKNVMQNSRSLILNPSAQVKLRKNTIGFFIAESSKELRRASFYCSVCHADVNTPELIGKCACKIKNQRQPITGTSVVTVKRPTKEFSVGLREEESFALTHSNITMISSVANRAFLYDKEQETEQLDSSGMYHWCKAISLEKVTLKRSDKTKYEFRNHVVACIFGDAQSTLMGLRNFVMPLRASNYTLKELKDIVFIGSLDYLQREWRFLRNFPHIYVLPGSALFTGDLHAINIEECSMCVVLSSPSKPSSSQTLVDTETIMATLNIGSLRVSPPTRTFSVPCLQKIHTEKGCEGTDPSVKCHPLFDQGQEEVTQNSNGNFKRSKYRRIPILTELKNPSNIHFIEQLGGMERGLSGTNLHLSTSFSTGTVFSGNFLDSLLATAFYNYHVLELLQMLVTGGTSSQLEQHLDKNKDCGLANNNSTHLQGRMRCKLGLLSLNQTILSDIQPRDYFGQVFCGSLDNFGILCVGLYRLIDEEEHNPQHKRFVITRPANDFKLLPSDLVFCAIPYSTSFCKKDVAISQNLYDTVNPETPSQEKSSGLDYPKINIITKNMSPSPSRELSTELRSSWFSLSKQTSLNHTGRLSVQIYPDDSRKENAKASVEEIIHKDDFASPNPN